MSKAPAIQLAPGAWRIPLAEVEYTTAAFTHGAHLSDEPREHIHRFLAEQNSL